MCVLAAPAPLSTACVWLDAWRATGSNVTIARDGSMHAWCLPTDDDPSGSRVQPLLRELDGDPALRASVRAVAHAEALLKATS